MLFALDVETALLAIYEARGVFPPAYARWSDPPSDPLVADERFRSGPPLHAAEHPGPVPADCAAVLARRRVGADLGQARERGVAGRHRGRRSAT